MFGVFGEIFAIAALATKSGTPFPGQQPGDTIVQDTVLSSVVFLTIVVAATSALALAKFLHGLGRQLLDTRR